MSSLQENLGYTLAISKATLCNSSVICDAHAGFVHAQLIKTRHQLLEITTSKELQ